MFNFSTPQVPQLDAKDLQSAIINNEECIILDVRTPHEFERGKIKNSINLPVNDVKEKIETIIPDKSKKIYVYCLSGSRSVFAVSQMLALGYKNVFDIKSGLLAWRINNFPIV
jgi:thioredoxin 1